MSGSDSGGDEQPTQPPRSDDAGPDAETTDNRVTIDDDGVVRWFLKTDNGTVVFARDILSSVAIVAVIGALLFALSGIWPPLVAVESGSMEPNMQRGDLIFVVAQDRFVGDNPTEGTGVVTLESGAETGEETFGQSGDVIIFEPDGDSTATPIIHRAHFWVEEGENWVETKADEASLNGRDCRSIDACPAPHDGFVTKGDANTAYDQVDDGRYAETTVVDPAWIEAKASVRIPFLGYSRLFFESVFSGVAVTVVFVSALAGLSICGRR